MRGKWLLVAALVGTGCAFDSAGNLGSIDGAADVRDAGPDAAVVQCIRDEECETPPSPCHLAGLCNPSTRQCEFPQKNCSAAGDQCNTGTCEPATGNCVATPAFDGEDCNGGTTCGSFGSCGDFDPSDICDETGTRGRDCTDRVCSSGACIDIDRVESEACARNQDGVECQVTVCGGFGSCTDFSDTCDEHGTRYRDCTAYACSSASCVSSNFTDSGSCMRSSRDGITCASDDCGSFGACMGFDDTCDESGTRERTCTPYRCTSELCLPETSFVDSISCSRDTDGVTCGEVCILICVGTGDCSTVCMGICVPECSDVLCAAGSCGP